MFKRVLRKAFFITLFYKQNKHHRYGVLKHSISLVWQCIKNKKYHMIMAAVLHDIGKPYIAHQKLIDKIRKEYSFNNHEEISYHIIKKWRVSQFTKDLVRYHYLKRGMQKAWDNGNTKRYNRLSRIYKSLPGPFITELLIFMELDDKAKQSF